MRRIVVAPVLTALSLLMPTASAAGPQITDPANDANFVNSQGQPLLATVPNNTPTPAGSQSYADVLTVEWKTLKTTKVVRRKRVTTVTGFQVVATLSGAPTPPQGTTIVYRMLGTTPNCPYFGVVHYSSKLSDPTTPQTALRDNCFGKTTARLTAIPAVAIKGSTLTWTVPIKAIPADTKVTVGSALTGLYFTVTEIEDFQGQKVPDAAPLGLGGSTGLGLGVLDDAKPGDAVYRIS
ncbi:MAG TPA: hypothetical protein VNA20_11620 [Frankiaceae bacterium]|nr:hypothetical protein [Frankiaceae bacterium]